jgi:hypothetical protein
MNEQVDGMNCYICFRLKTERRVRATRPATLIVAGHSLCDEHANLVDIDASTIRSLDLARGWLRRWWSEMERKHGMWDGESQLFADGTTYEETEGP